MEIELHKHRDKYFIRKGTTRTNCVVNSLTIEDLTELHKMIGKVIGKPDWKEEMEIDKKKFIG